MSKVQFLPSKRIAEVREGTNLLQAARRANVSIPTRCDGQAGCLMCKVHVVEGTGLMPATEKEMYKLGEQLIASGTRLACQATLRKEAKLVVVELSESPLKAAIRAQLLKQQEEDTLW
jgi:2Fe-2S ferredoxin